MTGRKQKALQALLTEPTKRAAAKKAGVGESTIREYLKDPEFLREYEGAVSEIISYATRQAQRALTPALTALEGIVASEDATDANKIAAARTLLEYGLKLSEIEDILKRLEAIEGNDVL